MKRVDAISKIAENLTDELVICNLGFPSRELYALRDRSENFYMLGSMGLASSISLGIALSQPRRRVFCLDGDGSLLMNLGSLSTIANCNPPNLILIVLDNGSYGSTGDQRTYTSGKTYLNRIATGAGFESVVEITHIEDIPLALREKSECSRFVLIKVNPGNAPVKNVPLPPEKIKERFMSVISSFRK